MRVLSMPLFWQALGNTAYFVVLGVPLSIGLSLAESDTVETIKDALPPEKVAERITLLLERQWQSARPSLQHSSSHLLTKRLNGNIREFIIETAACFCDLRLQLFDIYGRDWLIAG